MGDARYQGAGQAGPHLNSPPPGRGYGFNDSVTGAPKSRYHAWEEEGKDAWEGAGTGIETAAEWLDNLGKSGYEAGASSPWADQDLVGSRRKQNAAINSIGQWALTGEGPSAAQALLRGAQDQSNAAALSMAKSLPGGNLALAQRQAGAMMGANMSQAARDAAMLRAQEQQAMIDQYLRGVSDFRRGDIDVYGAYAQANSAAQAQNAETARQNAGKGIVQKILGDIL